MGETGQHFQSGREAVKRRFHIINVIGYSWIFVLAALGGWVGWMALDDLLPTEYLEEGAKIVPNPVEDGGRVRVLIKVKRNRMCPGTVYRTLRNAETGKIEAVYDPVPSMQASMMGDLMVTKTFELPEGLPPLMKYQARICFHCNLLQNLRPICTDAPDIFFRVIPRDPKAN